MIVIEFLVNIICTSYKHEKYIRNTIERMLRQNTIFNYELIITDDLYADNTDIIVAGYITNTIKEGNHVF